MVLKHDKSNYGTKSFDKSALVKPGESLHDWYQTPLGQSLLEQVKIKLEPLLSTSFGYYAVHLGCVESTSFIKQLCPVKHVFKMGPLQGRDDAIIDRGSLPVAADSVDMVILMHSLSSSRHPHAILREVNRVLIPDGKLIIIDFNPVSLWGLRHGLQSWLDEAPWAGHYYTSTRLRDWTRLLGFDQLLDTRCGYLLPLNYQRLIERSHLFSKFTQRWLSFSGALNILAFEKRLFPLTPARKRWAQRQILSPKIARPTVGRGMKYDK